VAGLSASRFILAVILSWYIHRQNVMLYDLTSHI